jgi:protein-tyrosine phosphatase
MGYAVIFVLFAIALVAGAVHARGIGWVMLWPALGCVVIAAGYGCLGPAVFGKRTDGRLSWWSFLVHGPYLLLIWITWRLGASLGREPAMHEVAPQLWLGRRVSARVLPAGVTLVVDLTSESPEPRCIVSDYHYLCVPTLDASVPSEEAFVSAVDEAMRAKGVFVHCASGHGRSAAFVAAMLIAQGKAVDVREAILLIRGQRPSVELNGCQRRLAQCVGRRLAERASTDHVPESPSA